MLATVAFTMPSPVAAQQADGEERPGRIQGRIVGSQDASPVTSAEVRLEGTQIGALSDVQGRYFLRDVPPGQYSLVVRSLGYAQKTVTGVTVEPGQTTNLDITLETQAVQVTDVTVSVEQARGTAASVLNRQKSSKPVIDAIGSQQISRSGAGNAAESAKQLSGVTVSEGKYVFVRGLGKRYSQTTLNGSPLASPNPEQGVVPLDLFPAGFLEGITSQKTYTPDLPGEFSGGSINLDIKEFPDRFTFKANIGSSLNAQSQLADGYLSYAGGSTDFLGIDDGSRDLPGLVKSELGGLEGQSLPNDPETVERIGESFLNGDLDTFAPSSGSTPGNVDVGFSMGDRTGLFGVDVGYFLAATYSNEYTIRDDEVEREWETSAFDPELVEQREVKPDTDFGFIRGTNTVEWGGVGNLTFLISPKHEVSLKGLFNQNADDEARQLAGENREDFGAELRGERLRFLSRSLGWGQLSGEHKLDALADSKLEWRATFSRAQRDEPGLREAIFERSFNAEPEDPFLLSNVSGESGRYLFTELTDDDLNGGLDWTVPFPFVGDRDAEIKVGGFTRNKTREFRGRRFRWRFQPRAVTSLDSALTAATVVGQVRGPNQFALDEVTEPGDNYDVDEELFAGYGMLTLPIGPVELVGGARIEDYDLVLETVFGSGREGEISETDVLPAVSATVALNETMNLRGAFSQTLDRPEFRELTPFQFTEATTLRQSVGNPDLEIAKLRNFDVRWEWFPSPGEVISVSGFYKDMDRPIEQVLVAAAGFLYTFQNAEEGELYGAELDFRKRLGFVGAALDDFTLGGNFTVLESEVEVSSEGRFDPTNEFRRLEGQPDFTVNANLTYQDPGESTEAGLFFHIFGDRLNTAGGAGIPDIFEQSRPELDFTLEQRLWPNIDLKIKALNLLDPAYEWTQSANGITRVQRLYHKGQSFSASLSITN